MCLVPVSFPDDFHLDCPQPLGTRELPRPNICRSAFHIRVPGKILCVPSEENLESHCNTYLACQKFSLPGLSGQDQMVLASLPDGLLHPPMILGSRNSFKGDNQPG